MGPSGFVAVLAGWITTEVGRQPYTVYGLLRTADSVSPIDAPAVAASLIAFIVVYFTVFGAGIVLHPAPDGHAPQPGRARHRAGRCRPAPPASRPRPRCEQAGGAARRSERMDLDLAFIWAGLIAFAVLAYVLFDGFDLGIGILFPFLDGEARPRPGDELGGAGVGRQRDLAGARRRRPDGGLPARLCHRHAGALRADHRHAAGARSSAASPSSSAGARERGKFLWDWAFAGGSIVAAFAQGIALGALVQGIPVADRAYAGGWWDWLTPFSLLTGVALVVGYALLGATWLILKTDGRAAGARPTASPGSPASARWR